MLAVSIEPNMNYRSVGDLSQLISHSMHKIPRDAEIIVGIPRSGMLTASIIALKANLPLTDLYSFLRNDELRRGKTRSYKLSHLVHPQDARKILLVDDSVSTGSSLAEAKGRLKEFIAAGGEVVTLAAYAERRSGDLVDIHFDLVGHPRMFEWNVMHHPRLIDACMDIDGVLCVDPTEEENDDGPRYLEFINNARPLIIPTIKVKRLVTSRLEKYRQPTEAWLARHGVQYGSLHMVDLPSAGERRRLKIHHKFKANVYASDIESTLFVESEPGQAIEIMRRTNKPVYCTEDNQMYVPGVSIGSISVKAGRKAIRIRSKVLNRVRALRRKLHGLLVNG